MSWNELSLKDKADYIKESVNNGIYNLSDIRNRYNMYANGGYKPSESIKKRITNWEGSSMRTNRSFQAEANDFNRVIPSSIRSKLSQQQLDALYSYGYNVGMGNLKKRVLPTLTNYVQGKASNEDVQKSMWASKDNELRGLTTRRNIERSLFGGNYQTIFTGTGGTPHNYGYIAANTNRSSSNPYQIQNEEWQGKNYLDAYKGLQLSMNDIMGKTKETDIDDLFSTGTGPIISMDNLLSIGNNTVAPVQPDYSYAKSLLSDFDSDLNSNMFGNGGKIPKTYQGDLSHLKDVGYQKWRANLPTNLREETSDYNLYEAYKSGAKPRLESDGYYHLPSRDPRTNKILKKPTHPTYGMALREDAIEGYLPIYKNGETYTYPLPWIKADGGKLNMFAEGGNMDNNRTAMPAHPATNPYKRRSWETDEEYKERIQDLDNKSQEVALNDSTAINKYKEWEANIQKQQKINEEKSKAITIEKNTKRAKTLEKEFNSLRNIPSQMSPNDTIQAINKNIPEAYKQQYINNINMYKPALDTIDLGINLYSLYNPTVPVLSAGLLTNGLQFGQSIVDEDLGATDYSALAFDTLGLLGATNKLPTRLRIGKNRFWDIDKIADYLGAGQNILDSAGDIYDLGKTGYHLYNNKGNNNLYMSPFKKSFDEGGNLSYIDADNRRHKILLHVEDGNLYDSAGNNYTQSYLDEEHIPTIKGTMPRNTRQYYDPNTTLEFINAATAPISNFSPSNIVGSIREARDYNTFMNSFMNQDNTGFFTREYAKEHPYISTLGNIGGDILLGTAFDKLGDLKDTSTYRKLGYKFNKLQKKLGLVDRGDTQFFYYPNDYVSKVLEGINTRNPELLNDWIRVSGATDKDLEAFIKMYKKRAFPIPNTIEYNGQTIQLPNSWKQLFADNPEYYEFIQRTGLDPMLQETVDKFMLRQGTSLRGVTTNNPMNAQKYLTETEVGRHMKGGDRLRTNGGLYTSNSTGIADAFKNPTANKEEAGYVGTLFHNFQTDKSQSIAEQLKQYRDKIGFSNEGDIFAGTKFQNLSRNKYLEDRVIALESPYGRSNGDMLRVTERAYLPPIGQKGTKGKPVEILESNFYPSQVDKKGRWNTAGVEHTLYDENYFLPRQYNSTSDFIRNARILLKKDWVPNIDKKNKVGQDIIDTYHNRANLLNELKRKSKSWKY